ncbi:hypothetical protein M885DRAFT_527157 [Pelagophyceae sp. CCMP2097]|nr:hypothetical protein M885DRAFT_527157 [Pelagophyceae sp. CCMP2097]
MPRTNRAPPRPRIPVTRHTEPRGRGARGRCSNGRSEMNRDPVPASSEAGTEVYTEVYIHTV